MRTCLLSGLRQVWSALGLEDELNGGDEEAMESASLQQMLAGKQHLQEFSSEAVLEVQSHLRLLRLPQLLKLYLLQMGRQPRQVRGAEHSTFLARLEVLVYEMLGEKALQAVETTDPDREVLHSLGMELTLFFAASRLKVEAEEESAAWPPSPWWTASITMGSSVLFFHAGDFRCSTEFPGADARAMQVRDCSRPDHHHGRIDWIVTLVGNRADLATPLPYSSPQEEAVQEGDMGMLEDLDDPVSY